MESNLKQEMSVLIDKYLVIKDELLDFTQEHHDNMYWDICGWMETYHEDDDITEKDIQPLRKSVDDHQRLLDIYKGGFEYTFC